MCRASSAPAEVSPEVGEETEDARTRDVRGEAPPRSEGACWWLRWKTREILDRIEVPFVEALILTASWFSSFFSSLSS